MYLAGAILNVLIGIFFIRMGINKYGKKEFLNSYGYTYIVIIAIGTIILMSKAL